MVPHSLHRLSLDNSSSVFHRHSTEEEAISRRSLPQINPLCVSDKLSLSSKTKTPGHRGDKPHITTVHQPSHLKKKIFPYLLFFSRCPVSISRCHLTTDTETQNNYPPIPQKPRRGKSPLLLAPSKGLHVR